MKQDAVEQAVRKLGTVLQADSRYLAYQQAKAESDQDTALQAQIQTFHTLQLQYQQEAKKLAFQQNLDKLERLEQEASVQYAAIRENPHMVALEAAQQGWDEMIQMVYAVLSRSISGENPLNCPIAAKENCNGNCAACDGCDNR